MPAKQERRKSPQRTPRKGLDMQAKFTLEVRRVLGAEQSGLEALRQFSQEAQNPSLRATLDHHATETEQQIERLEEVLTLLGGATKPEKDAVTEALRKDTDKLLKRLTDPALIDCAVSAAAVRGEHLEIAAYRDLVQAAATFHPQILQLLQANLQQEEMAASLLESNAPGLLQAIPAELRGQPVAQPSAGAPSQIVTAVQEAQAVSGTASGDPIAQQAIADAAQRAP